MFFFFLNMEMEYGNLQKIFGNLETVHSSVQCSVNNAL